MLKFRKKTEVNHTKHENRKQKKKLSDFNLKKNATRKVFFKKAFFFFFFFKDLLFLHQCIYNIITERTYENNKINYKTHNKTFHNKKSSFSKSLHGNQFFIECGQKSVYYNNLKKNFCDQII